MRCGDQVGLMSNESGRRCKKRLVTCPFPVGFAAGQRLKYEQYVGGLRTMGFDINVSSFMDTPMWNTTYARGYYAAIFGILRGHFRRIADVQDRRCVWLVELRNPCRTQ